MKFSRKIEAKIEDSLQEDYAYISCVLCEKKAVFFYKIRDEFEQDSDSKNSKKYTRIFYAGYCDKHDKEYKEKTKETILKKLLLDAPTYFFREDDLWYFFYGKIIDFLYNTKFFGIR